MMRWMRSLWRRDHGAALIETAFTLPLLLFISIAIIEFGRAYQAWQIVTNAAREGARIGSLPDTTDSAIVSRVQAYLSAGHIDNPSAATVQIDHNAAIAVGTGTRVEVDYPFTFMVMQPVAQLLVNGSSVGTPFTMSASATMRNE